MVKKLAVVSCLIFFAIGVLAASVFRTISPEYVFSQGTRPELDVQPSAVEEFDYYLTYPGVLPDHFLWPIKAARDRTWLFLTTDPSKKSELLVLLSDKRIGASRALFEEKKVGLAVETAWKAEQYLAEAIVEEKKAREKGDDTSKLLRQQLALSAIKHREILERMYGRATDDPRVEISKILEKYTKPAYEDIKASLTKLNIPRPISPFEE